MDEIRSVTTEEYMTMTPEQRRNYYYKLYESLGSISFLAPEITFSDMKGHPQNFRAEYNTYMSFNRVLENLVNIASGLFESAADVCHHGVKDSAKTS